MKKYYFLLILFSISIYAQPRFDPNIILVESEVHIIKTTENNRGFFLYKIPHSRLVFHKQDDSFTAGFKVFLEITNKLSGEIIRESKEHHTSVSDFTSTNSPEIYLQGYIEFNIDNGDFIISPVFTDINSNRELRSKKSVLNTDSVVSVIGNPIVVVSQQTICNEVEGYKIANYSGSIPFSSINYSLLIPVYDKSIDTIDLKISSETRKESGLTEKVDKVIQTSFNLAECEGNIFFTQNNVKTIDNFNLFVVENISQKLSEDIYTLEISYEKNTVFKKSITIPVRWINKPRSLFDPEKSLEYLTLIENPDAISHLRDARKENLTFELFEFWKKYDPTPETTYNELMTEFYSRVDYAESNFRALSNNNGAKTDRGKIYVQYGKPESMERFTDEYGRMIEQWKYATPQLTFNFIDKKGTGNFTLLSSQ